jgi:hypothetical protein
MFNIHNVSGLHILPNIQRILGSIPIAAINIEDKNILKTGVQTTPEMFYSYTKYLSDNGQCSDCPECICDN